MNQSNLLRAVIVVGICVIGLFSTGVCCADTDFNLSKGATVYVPVYSHVYIGVKGNRFDLAVSLSIRNADLNKSISVSSVNYYDSSGKLVREFLREPREVAPLASAEFFISESDTTGGFGATFVVKWKSQAKAHEPIIQGVMVGTGSQQGVSFITNGRIIGDTESNQP